MRVSEEVRRAREAAILAALEYVEDGMVVGFGTGSTMAQAVHHLRRRVEEDGLRLLFVPTSFQSRQLLLDNKLSVTSLYEYPEPDLAIDSFDQSDRSGNVIKGGGGAMMMEKVVAQASRRVIFVGDYMKLVERLSMPVPVEILEKAYPHVYSALARMNFRLRLRESGGKVGPVVSENGNLIGDVDAGPVPDPEQLDRLLKSIAGVLETGLFPRFADRIIIGRPDGGVEVFRVDRKRV